MPRQVIPVAAPRCASASNSQRLHGAARHRSGTLPEASALARIGKRQSVCGWPALAQFVLRGRLPKVL
jgi:hypothetical protein